MIDYDATTSVESIRLREVAESELTMPVPSCPGWTIADLLWHMAEVQHFWASMLSDDIPDPSGYRRPDRPDDSELPALFGRQTEDLVAALAGRGSDEPCWSWYEKGRNVGWVRRRQAHEALIHRLDVELALGIEPAVGHDIGVDGVDEILTTMLDSNDLTAGLDFDSDGPTVRLDAATWFWTAAVGRVTGASPRGEPVDAPGLRLVDGASHTPADTVVSGAGGDLDRWLWGRGSLDALTVDGDASGAERIRAVAVDRTQ